MINIYLDSIDISKALLKDLNFFIWKLLAFSSIVRRRTRMEVPIP